MRDNQTSIEKVLASKGWADFISFAVDELEKEGLMLVIEERQYLQDSCGRFRGYFSEEIGVCVASKAWYWPLVLIHEMSHFLIWKQNDRHLDFLPNVLLTKWLEGGEIDNPSEVILNCLNDELVTERKTVEVLHRFNIPYDTGTYIKDANAYLLFWCWVLDHRKWDNRVASDSKVISLCCDYFFDGPYDYILEYQKNHELRLAMNEAHDAKP